MNILIISNNFSTGGLETQIDTMYNELRKNHNIYFAFSNYKKGKYLKNANIYDNFKFNINCSISDFCYDVDNLIEIIKRHKIDVIHVHPFHSIFPAIFAANYTETKIVYTYHGRTSLNFFNNINEEIIYDFAIENIFNKIFCVSREALPWFNDYKKNQAIHFPNIINEKKYIEHTINPNKKWALISRLDYDKKIEIEKIIKNYSKLDINGIDIYGDGSEKEAIEILIRELKLENKICLKGYSYNIYNNINNKYNGIIGLGRVALEGLTMNYPVLLIGYGKISGLIDKECYDRIKNINFVNTEEKEIDIGTLKEQLKKLNNNLNIYQLRNIISKEFGTKKIRVYEKELENIVPAKIHLLDNVYNDIKKLKYKEDIFYKSSNVFYMLTQLGNYTKNVQLKSKINTYQTMYINNHYFKCDISNLNTEIKELKKELYKYKEYQKDKDKEIELLNETIINMKNSKSWKITKPLRVISNFLKRNKK